MSMHDSSREYVLAGSQQHPELSLALNQVGRERERERERGRRRERGGKAERAAKDENESRKINF